MILRTIAILVIVLALTMGCAADKPESAGNDAAANNDTEKTDEAETGETMADDFTMPNLEELEWTDGPEGLKYAVIKEGIGTDVKAGSLMGLPASGELSPS